MVLGMVVEHGSDTWVITLIWGHQTSKIEQSIFAKIVNDNGPTVHPKLFCYTLVKRLTYSCTIS